MKRNSGIISKTIQFDASDVAGVYDIHDTFIYDDNIPKNPIISSVSASGEHGGTTSADIRINWGVSTFTFTYTGVDLSGYNYDIEWTGVGVSTTYTADGTWTKTNVSPSNDTTLTYTNGLRIQRESVTGDFSITVNVKIAGTSTILFTHTVAIPDYNVKVSTYTPRSEGDSVYTSLTLEGTSSLVDTSLDIRVYNSWTTQDFYTDVTPTDYAGSWNSYYYFTYYSFFMGTIREDMLTEGDETFGMSYRAWNHAYLTYNYFIPQTSGVGYSQFVITDTSKNFTTTISDSTPNEGDTITITCEAEDSSGELVNWQLTSASVASSSDINPTSGSFSMSGTTNANGKHYYALSITVSRDFITEGTETFAIEFRNQNNDLVHTSSNITIQDTTALGSVSQTATSINEGGSVTFTINVTGAQSGVNYTHYWKTVGLTSASGTPGQASDFSDGATSGSFTISGTTGQGTVTRTMASDGYTEGTETWKLQVSNASTGPWEDAGLTVTVNDTSTGTAEPAAGIGSDVANILSAVSSYTSSTNYATIISAINGAGNGYKVVATPRRGAMAESMTGVNGASALSTSGTGHFDYAAWNDSTNYLELSSGFSNSTLNGYPYMGFVMFNSSGPYGVAIMLFRDYTSSTTLLKNLWYPNTDRELYTYVLNANNSTVIDTSGNTSTIYSDNQQPGTNGYNSTSKFAADDGVWGFVNGTTRLDGNGGPYPSNSPSNAYGPPANQNAGDSSNTPHYWGASYNTSTTTDTAPVGGAYFFIKYS